MKSKFFTLLLAVLFKAIFGGAIAALGAWLLVKGLSLPFSSIATGSTILGIVLLGIGIGLAWTKPDKTLSLFGRQFER